MPVTINGTTGIAGPDGSASTPAVQGTDSNTGLFYPAADTAAITTGGSERMRIDSSGKVGIGVTPSAWTVTSVLQLSNGNVRSSGNTVAIGANWFFDGASKYIANDFASDNYHQDGDIIWRNAPSGTAGNSITWSERMRINADGTIKTGSTISVGGATPSTSGAGITFPATQSASSDANTLDDYEEGTWTPGVAFGGGTTGVTFGSTTGNYLKIGKLLFLNFRIAFSNKGSSSGAATITGSPFTFNSSNTVSAIAGVSFGPTDDLTFTANLTGNPVGGGTTIQIIRNVSGSTAVDITEANFANSTVLRGSVVTLTA